MPRDRRGRPKLPRNAPTHLILHGANGKRTSIHSYQADEIPKSFSTATDTKHPACPSPALDTHYHNYHNYINSMPRISPGSNTNAAFFSIGENLNGSDYVFTSRRRVWQERSPTTVDNGMMACLCFIVQLVHQASGLCWLPNSVLHLCPVLANNYELVPFVWIKLLPINVCKLRALVICAQRNASRSRWSPFAIVAAAKQPSHANFAQRVFFVGNVVR